MDCGLQDSPKVMKMSMQAVSFLENLHQSATVYSINSTWFSSRLLLT
jgi:hypothetical protein